MISAAVVSVDFVPIKLCASVCSQSGSRLSIVSSYFSKWLSTDFCQILFPDTCQGSGFKRVAADLSRACYASVSCGFAAILEFAATAVLATKLLFEMVLQDQGDLVVGVRNEHDFLSGRVFGERTHLVLDVFA